MTSRVPLNEAVDMIVGAASAVHGCSPSDLRAAVTHWIASPEDAPPLVTAENVAVWRDLVDPAAVSWEGVPFPPVSTPAFRFVDLFAGIGGFRVAMQSLGGKCVFSSEWNSSARDTYERNFGEVPYGDIARFAPEGADLRTVSELVPDHEVLCAGFPCQPFSKAGVSARNALGYSHGFACATQGTAFFHIARIIEAKRPRVVILENVRNLRSHDSGRTLRTIEQVLSGQLDESGDRASGLGYTLAIGELNSSAVVPQRRTRLFLVAFRDSEDAQGFTWPDLAGEPLPLSDALDADVPEAYTISDRLWRGHQERSKRNREAGKGFVAGVADLSKPAATLVARYGKDGKECLIPGAAGSNPRMLTPNECRKLMGFPPDYILPASRAAAYRQFGNAIVVPVVRAIAERALVHVAVPTQSPSTRQRLRQGLLNWGKRNYQSYSWRSTTEHWHALLAEVLLQRTKAAKVAEVIPSILARWPRPSDMHSASIQELRDAMHSLGRLERVLTLRDLAGAVRDAIPVEQRALEALPGVGPYTAAAYRSLHLGKRAVLVDSNVARLICRLNGWTYTPESRRDTRVLDAAEMLTPTRAHRAYNYAVLDFTMLICRPAAPHCDSCPLADDCTSRNLYGAG